ncbi:MAG: SUF system NifU family Fe-S cluster assembly protein [Planctomycetes bacterium]|nr:SUF system NifU family Fe-S cluster assembly protein [Planctomycetota bacterium]
MPHADSEGPDGSHEFYGQVLLDHARHPRRRGVLPGADLDVSRANPVCGDEVRFTASLRGDILEDVRFAGRGCAVSLASASLAAEALTGRTTSEARRLALAFRALMKGEEPDAGAPLGDLAALASVRAYPVRVACALLPWSAVEEALAAT